MNKNIEVGRLRNRLDHVYMKTCFLFKPHSYNLCIPENANIGRRGVIDKLCTLILYENIIQP